MKCPFCNHLHDKVVDSRESKEGDAIRRRRECLKCERRYTTYERIDEVPYMVVKRRFGILKYRSSLRFPPRLGVSAVKFGP